jgi:hypothetical protein
MEQRGELCKEAPIRHDSPKVVVRQFLGADIDSC